MYLRKHALLGLCCVVFCGPAAFSAETCGPKVDAGAWRGINVSLGARHEQEDFRKIASWGANTVRIAIQGDPARARNNRLVDPQTLTVDETGLARLDEFVAYAKNAGLKVIIDLHTFPGHSDGMIWREQRYWDIFAENWKLIAEHYRKEPTVLGYDLMNEPNLVDALDGSEKALIQRAMRGGGWRMPPAWKKSPRDYYFQIGRVATLINQVDPRKAVIVEGFGLWGAGENYEWMEPLNACNLVYSFHLYRPHAFTHSGREGFPQDLTYERQRDFGAIKKSVDIVADFARKYSAQIWVGEFGVTFYSENRGGAEWMEDAIGLFEQHGWGWAYWTYSIPLRSLELGEDGTPTGTSSRRLQVFMKFAGHRE